MASRWVKTETFGTTCRISCSIRSRSAWPAATLQAPGTSTWTETKRREAACRLRSAWNWTSGPRWASRTRCTAACSSAGRAVSRSPSAERRTSCAPAQVMFTATAMATMGSSRSQPVRATTPMPASTPAEVQTSVMRWWASASSAMEWCLRPARYRTLATPKLMREAPVETSRPMPIFSMGAGWSSRSTADQAIATAATMMSPPSTPLAKYSALSCP